MRALGGWVVALLGVTMVLNFLIELVPARHIRLIALARVSLLCIDLPAIIYLLFFV